MKKFIPLLIWVTFLLLLSTRPNLFILLFVILFLGGFILIIMRASKGARSFNQQERQLQTSDIQPLKSGLVEIKGKFATNTPITTILSQKKSLYSRYHAQKITGHRLTKKGQKIPIYEDLLTSERWAEQLYIQDQTGKIEVDITHLKLRSHDVMEKEDTLHNIRYTEKSWDLEQEVILIGFADIQGSRRIITQDPESKTLSARYYKDVQSDRKLFWILRIFLLTLTFPLLALLITAYCNYEIIGSRLLLSLPYLETPVTISIQALLTTQKWLSFIPQEIALYAFSYYIFIFLVILPLLLLMAKMTAIFKLAQYFLITYLYALIPSLISFIGASLLGFDIPKMWLSLFITIALCSLLAVIRLPFIQSKSRPIKDDLNLIQ